MRRLLWIARHDYLRHARRRGFLLASIGMPILMLGGVGLMILVQIRAAHAEPALAYVDQSGLLAHGAPAAGAVPLQAYPDQGAASAALAAGQIDAYAVIPPDYAATGTFAIYGRAQISPAARDSLRAALSRGLLARAGIAPELMPRAIDPLGEVQLRGADDMVVESTELIGHGVAAVIGSLLFVVTVASSATYLLQALVEEKENRTMEIVTTSVAPWQLIGGKTLGLGLLGLSIGLAWLLGLLVAWAIGAAALAPLRAVALPLDIVALATVALPLGLLLFAGLMVLVSALVPTAQEGQPLAGLATAIAALPLLLSALFFSAPAGPIPIALSLFPLSAPVALLLRLAVGSVPAWQVALSLGLLAATAILAILAASRIFRVGMLRYGQRLGLRAALRALWAA
ncbi:MAG: ABC transporter permease [Chloroflexales bacterium]